MDSATDLAALVRHVHAVVDDAVARLRAAGARDEALGEYVEPRPVLGIRREPTMRSLGRVWRLGALLLADDGSVWATGLTTRVTEPGRPQYQSQSAEIRRAYRAAASHGRFRPGETVNHDATPIAIDASLATSAGPLFIRDGRALVRWSPSVDDGAAVPLETYLTDRVDLLVHPPEGT